MVAGDLLSVAPSLFDHLTCEELRDLAEALRVALAGHDGFPTDPAWHAMAAEAARDYRRNNR